MYLGIDGGGTGCRAALADASGRILGRGAAGPANVRTDLEGTLASILTALRAASDDAIASGALAAAPEPGELTAVLGLAGANVTASAEALARRLPFGRSQIVSDGVTALHGALGARDGIVAALGTGSVFSRLHKGEVRQVGGRGFVLGDEASGAVLGRALLADVLRAEDGLIASTPLLARLLDEMGGGEAIIEFGFRASPADFAALVPGMLRSGDPAAEAILDQATQTLRGILEALQPAGARLPVVLIGGLAPVYRPRLANTFELIEPEGAALEGAVKLALRLGGGA